MALIKVKPTSPGRRALVKVVTKELHKGAPFNALTESKKRGSGRNNSGSNTIRTGARIWRCCSTPTASAAISSRRAACPRVRS